MSQLRQVRDDQGHRVRIRFRKTATTLFVKFGRVKEIQQVEFECITAGIKKVCARVKIIKIII